MFVALHLHTDDLLRELEIMDLGHHSGAATVPPELHEVIRDTLNRYRDSRESAWQQAEAARRGGLEHLDIELRLPVEAADAAEEVAALFERTNDLARDGVLLTVPLEPELLVLRRWMTAELVRQLRDGSNPSPWPSG
jgi:hypothetical protein